MTYICPYCGSEAKVGGLCPGCTKKRKKPAKPARKSWEQDKSADGLDLPGKGDDFDYDDFIAREFGKAPHKKAGLKWYWWALAALLLALMIVGAGRI